MQIAHSVAGIPGKIKKTSTKMVNEVGKTGARVIKRSTSAAESASSILLGTDSPRSSLASDSFANELGSDVEEQDEQSEHSTANGQDPQQHATDTDHGASPSTLPDISKNPLPDIASTSAILGVTFGFGLTSMLISKLCTAPMYLMALSFFHFCEFWVTAKYNPTRVHSESFIINNGSAYTIAHTFALVETAVEYYYFPQFKLSYFPIKLFGFALIIGGQSVRTLAMMTAGKSFNHLVQARRANDHELVTEGVYYYLRHPSYFGFFWWAIGTQIMLLNPISLLGFSAFLYSFFQDRIHYEETFLKSFFGEKYTAYSERTPVYIPFL